MKKIVVAVLMASFISACNTTPDGYTLKGELRGDVENGTQVFLKTSDSVSRALVELDTTTVENGEFHFTGVAELPQLN